MRVKIELVYITGSKVVLDCHDLPKTDENTGDFLFLTDAGVVAVPKRDLMRMRSTYVDPKL